MEFDAEFFVLLGFLVFVAVLIYFGAHRIVLKALDARGEAIAAELAQAAKLREEATALLASEESAVTALIEEKLGDIIFSANDESMEQVVAKLLSAGPTTLAVAESLTGGLIASRLMDWKSAPVVALIWDQVVWSRVSNTPPPRIASRAPRRARMEIGDSTSTRVVISPTL